MNQDFTIEAGSKLIAVFRDDHVFIPAAGLSKLFGSEGKTIYYRDIVRFSLMQNSSVLSFYIAADDNGKTKGTNIAYGLDPDAAVIDFEKAVSIVKACNPEVKVYFPDAIMKSCR